MGSFQTRPMLIVHCYRVINERELQPLNPNDDYVITCVSFVFNLWLDPVPTLVYVKKVVKGD